MLLPMLMRNWLFSPFRQPVCLQAEMLGVRREEEGTVWADTEG